MPGRSNSNKSEKEQKWSEVLKKVVSTGIGAAFMTEDAVKSILSDLSLPKDIMSGLLQNARNTKEDFFNGIRNEVKKHLKTIDFSKEVEKVLDKYDIEVNATFHLKKKKGLKKSPASPSSVEE